MTLTLLRSMRVNKSFADFTVLGSQYENDDGIREWHLAIGLKAIPESGLIGYRRLQTRPGLWVLIWRP